MNCKELNIFDIDYRKRNKVLINEIDLIMTREKRFRVKPYSLNLTEIVIHAYKRNGQ